MMFSLRQLQEKCREQRRPSYITFIDLTKAFDLVSRAGLFTLLQRIGCPPKLLRMITSFHEDMKGTVQYDGSSSDPFPILAPTLFGNLFSLLLRYAFSQSEEGVYLHTRSDGSLFNLARLRAKTKVRKVLIRELLFADDDALTAHTEAALQELISCFAQACTEFGLIISIKKANILAQDVSSIPSISIGDCTLIAMEDFTYLGSTISSSLSLDSELNSRISVKSSRRKGEHADAREQSQHHRTTTSSPAPTVAGSAAPGSGSTATAGTAAPPRTDSQQAQSP